MKLQCKNKGNNKSITTGKEYEVINETEARYAIINDKGVQANYAKNLFLEAIEVAPQIPIIDGFEVETSILNNDNELGFKIIVKIEGADDYVCEEDDILNVLESDISCGIKTITHLDGLMIFINDFKENFKTYLEENKHLFTVDEDFDFDAFYKEIVELLIADLLEDYQGHCLYLLLSTNINNNISYNEDVIKTLDDCSEVNLFGANPNSGNNIKLWVLKCN